MTLRCGRRRPLSAILVADLGAVTAVDVPEAHVEVIDLVYGSRRMKAVLAEHLDQPADELSINIELA